MRENIPGIKGSSPPPAPTQVLTGQFVIAPVGWLPEDAPWRLTAVTFASLSTEEDHDLTAISDGALMFSTN